MIRARSFWTTGSLSSSSPAPQVSSLQNAAGFWALCASGSKRMLLYAASRSSRYTEYTRIHADMSQVSLVVWSAKLSRRSRRCVPVRSWYLIISSWKDGSTSRIRRWNTMSVFSATNQPGLSSNRLESLCTVYCTCMRGDAAAHAIFSTATCLSLGGLGFCIVALMTATSMTTVSPARILLISTSIRSCMLPPICLALSMAFCLSLGSGM
mmetsp:Transcript_14776/g.39855  ORF Transcript_14776/g.39855 Transcript_14776/m.39855 type:complete len:210 (+) Transcript_14776:737-1366(+)